ncbi:HAD-IIIC family phosphatase [Paenibacillus sp. HJL G12]|uniref:HAD-IIIC family phosphatase n=1 Tax=Paenibacillus dendrobii TaxID=2691084 RepID=A0A7X3IJI3_9BACL|nr:HAD-IIIC family phosphatase [Paenibacillus dendrobii]MWV44653.1 HAD-IIIC family phosphatase [Paenibacillus dendrobii]
MDLNPDRRGDAAELIREETKVKCVVWDLDQTIWDGILLEDKRVTLRGEVLEVIRKLDERGILQSIASKNDADAAMAKLEELGIQEYFLYPQISWGSKSEAIKNIASLININPNTIAFIDDQPFEREEVEFSLPQVRCIAAEDMNLILERADMTPRFITEDSQLRRSMYMTDRVRKEEEQHFSGTKEEFLATLNMVFGIYPAGEGDLQRAEELTLRTHQLNATGYTYSYQELDEFRKSDRHRLWVSELEDKYGTYGKIGIALVECSEEVWTLKLLLMSCRVMSRGVGSIMLNFIMNEAHKSGCKLWAEFVENSVNRMMYITYKFAGFQEVGKNGDILILENDLTSIQPFPDYVKVTCSE